MAALPTQTASIVGTALTFAAATVTTGDTFVADDRTSLHVKNGSGSSINVTLTVGPKGVAGTTQGPLVVAVAAGAHTVIGPFKASDWNDPTNGNVTAVCSAVTTVTVAAVRQ